MNGSLLQTKADTHNLKMDKMPFFAPAEQHVYRKADRSTSALQRSAMWLVCRMRRGCRCLFSSESRIDADATDYADWKHFLDCCLNQDFQGSRK